MKRKALEVWLCRTRGYWGECAEVLKMADSARLFREVPQPKKARAKRRKGNR